MFVVSTAAGGRFPGAPFVETDIRGDWRDDALRLAPFRVSRLSAKAGDRVRVPAATRDYVVLVKERAAAAAGTATRGR